MAIENKEFQRLLHACNEVASLFPDGIVFIGGIAIYLHAINNDFANMAEMTNDGDFYISLSDMADLRDIEEVTPNRQLSKHQFIKSGFEFDVYTERQSSLNVPYDEAIARSVTYDAIRVARLEHLLVLKIEAYRDRHGSTKGMKDASDIIRIAQIAHKIGFDHELASAYFSDEHIELLKKIRNGSETISMAKGNAAIAKMLKQKLITLVDLQIAAHR